MRGAWRVLQAEHPMIIHIVSLILSYPPCGQNNPCSYVSPHTNKCEVVNTCV